MVYATATDLTNSYDVNVIVQLCTDTDTPITVNQIPLNTYVVSSIARASADIRMACQVAQTYTDTDLTNIFSSGDESIRNQLVGLCVDRAFGYLINRRAQVAQDYEQLSIRARMTDEIIDALRKGYKLFSLPEQQAKGAQVEIVPVETSALNSITRSIPRFFPGGLPSGNSLLGER